MFNFFKKKSKVESTELSTSVNIGKKLFNHSNSYTSVNDAICKDGLYTMQIKMIFPKTVYRSFGPFKDPEQALEASLKICEEEIIRLFEDLNTLPKIQITEGDCMSSIRILYKEFSKNIQNVAGFDISINKLNTGQSFNNSNPGYVRLVENDENHNHVPVYNAIKKLKQFKIK